MFSSKRTQEAELRNINILSAVNRNISWALKAKQEISQYYGSEFRDPTSIVNLFRHHDDRDKIMYIIRIVSEYHLAPTDVATRKSNLSYTILNGNHKSAKTNLNSASL